MEKEAMKRHCPATAKPTEPPRPKESASSACEKTMVAA